MKYIRKRLIITGVIMTMGLGLAGCTKTDENTDEVSGPAVEAEDLPGAETPEGNGADGETSDGNSLNGENPEAEGADNEGGQHADSSDNGQKDAEFSSLRYIPDEEGDLLGDICEIGDGQFMVTEIHTESNDDGSGTMVSVAEGSEGASPKITVSYDEDTVFEKQKIWDGGANHEEREGSASDLQKGFTAEMWGSYEGDVFHATAIKVVEVILE